MEKKKKFRHEKNRNPAGGAANTSSGGLGGSAGSSHGPGTGARGRGHGRGQ